MYYDILKITINEKSGGGQNLKISVTKAFCNEILEKESLQSHRNVYCQRIIRQRLPRWIEHIFQLANIKLFFFCEL